MMRRICSKIGILTRVHVYGANSPFVGAVVPCCIILCLAVIILLP